MSMKIIFYDVEHGSCCHIITPNDTHILVDVGSKSNKSIVEHIRLKYFSQNGKTIDELIITHPHEDHIYDLPNLYRYLPPRVLSRPTAAFDITPTQNTQAHIEIANYANRMNKDYNNPVPDNQLPTYAPINGGVEFSFISPKPEWTTKDDLNTFSIIIIVKYCGYKFVLTGDNPSVILKKMMTENHGDIKSKVSNATVLLAPHHGRAGEFCQEFFDCVSPYLTVVSDKSIVHETQEETANLYKGKGVKLGDKERFVLTTRNDGTLIFEVEGNDCVVSMGEEDY